MNYDQALGLLHRYGGNEPWTKHCIAVARVADEVGRNLAKKAEVDERLLTVGALLHDIGRYKTQDPVLHGVEGYRLLTRLGHYREAFICASHVFCGMPAHEAVRYGLPEQDFLPQSIEERLIPLIDGVVEFDRATTLQERFSSISRRYRANPVFLERFEQAAETAHHYLRAFQVEYGISIEQAAIQALK